MKRFDRGRKIKVRKNDAGAMIVEAYPSRTGIQKYIVDGKIVNEFRSKEEVFSQESLDSFWGAVVTIFHPDEMVNPSNSKEFSVGTVLSPASPSDDHTKTTLQILREDAIKRVESGELVELSVGYTCDVVPQAGEHNGLKYDAVQKNIRCNHIALLPAGAGRAGVTARLKLDTADGVEECDKIDGNTQTEPKKEKPMAKVKINNMEFECEDNLAQALQAERDVAQAKLDSLEESKKETQKKLDSIDVKAEVKARVSLIEKCQKLDSKVDTSLDDIDMVKSVVSKQTKLDGKSNDYIMARFDMMLEDAEKTAKEKKDAQDAAASLTQTEKKTDSEETRSPVDCLVGKPLI